MTDEVGMGSILYPLFIVSGITAFIWIITHWEWLKDKMKGP